MMSEKQNEKQFVMELIEVSKRIYISKPSQAKKKFMSYAIADGIFAVLNKSLVGIKNMMLPKMPFVSNQLSLFG